MSLDIFCFFFLFNKFIGIWWQGLSASTSSTTTNSLLSFYKTFCLVSCSFLSNFFSFFYFFLHLPFTLSGVSITPKTFQSEQLQIPLFFVTLTKNYYNNDTISNADFFFLPLKFQIHVNFFYYYYNHEFFFNK